ncbi:hypothetical protein ACTFIU_001035 [Dictyostelium citrinum]
MNDQDYEVFLRSQENRHRPLHIEVDVDIENPSTGIGSQVDNTIYEKKKKKSSSKSKSLKKAPEESFLRTFMLSVGNGIFSGFIFTSIAIFKNYFFKGKSSLAFF